MSDELTRTAAMTDRGRGTFEKVASGLGYVLAREGDGYCYEEVEVAWQAWQAALTHKQREIDELRHTVNILLDTVEVEKEKRNSNI